MRNIMDNKLFQKNVSKAISDFYNSCQCIAHTFDASNCDGNKNIKSHSIGKSSQLHSIAELISNQRKVYYRNTNFGKMQQILSQPGHKTSAPFEEKSIDSTTIFNGFCHYHDSLLFNKIDLPISQWNDEVFVQFHYRAISYELFQLETVKRVYDILNNTYSHSGTKFLLNRNVNHINNLQSIAATCAQAYQSNQYNNIINKALYEFDADCPIRCSGTWIPEIDLDGNPLVDLNTNQQYPYMSYTLGIGANGKTFLAIAYTFDDSESNIKKFIDNVTSNMNGHLLNKIILFCLTHSSNVACRPSWYKGLSQEERDFIDFSFRQFEYDKYHDFSKDVLKKTCAVTKII